MDRQMEKFVDFAMGSSFSVAVTGAGISFSAGGLSSDDSSPSAMRDLMALGSEDVARNEPERYYECLDKAFLHSMFSVGPSPAHRMLARMEEMGKLDGIITTNIDCLHTIAGNKNVYEIQGSLQVNRCVDCGRHRDSYDIWAHGAAPRCEACGGGIWAFPFYSHIGLNFEKVQQAREAISKAELIILIGTKGPYSNAYWPYRNKNAKIVQINPGRTAFDFSADLNFRKGADGVLFELVEEIEKNHII
ncbi:MAG: NAD-dependent protein deacetylase [Clostridia bacterium]|nr:NAD-dependent protein deacetylase [Clostridia bacterium]